MPRPKVHPSQRQRVAEACYVCRAVKKRCSGTVPCISCQKKGKADLCRFPPTAKSPQLATTTVPAQRDEASYPDLNLFLGPTEFAETIQDDTIPVAPLPASSIGRLSETLPVFTKQAVRNQQLGNGPQARMLLNSRGERVYIGDAASISFLQLIRDTVVGSIGPSPFSDNAIRDNMLETESPVSGSKPPSSSLIADLSMEAKTAYASIYHSATGGFLDIFASSEIEGLLMATRPDSEIQLSTYKRASIDLVIAIGAQCESPGSSQQVGKKFFCEAQRLAFSAMLEDPNVDMVRMLILMAFYMLGECRRNAAFMYLGTASRAAVALGLHSSTSYLDMNDQKYRLRLRIWMSLWILDHLVCSILGRPPATVAPSSDMESFVTELETSATHDTLGLIGCYRIVRIISEVVANVYNKRTRSTKLIEETLEKIEKWAQSLPRSFRTPLSYSQSTSRDSIASIHVSCLYYFAISLVTRPSLILTLTTEQAAEDALHFQFASACLDAAVYLARTSADAQKVGLLLGNMCILKALVFATGLILGFNLFAMREVDHEVESAFHNAKEVLAFLAVQSPQAAHYREILSGLTTAVERQREQLADRGRESKHVKCLFSVDKSSFLEHGGHGEQNATIETDKDTPVGDEVQSARLASDTDLEQGQEAIQSMADGHGDTFLGWDSLDLLQWDIFPLKSPYDVRMDIS